MAPVCGDRRIVPYNLRLKAAARTLRRDSTPAERKLWYEFLARLLQVLRFTNAEVMRDFAGVCCRVQRVIETET